jgi:hypothetical protein
VGQTDRRGDLAVVHIDNSFLCNRPFRSYNIADIQHIPGIVFSFQLPCCTGPQNTRSRVNEEQNKKCLIQISRHRFSLVISGLTKILQRVNEMVRNLIYFINFV